MSLISADLHSKPPRPASLIQRVSSATFEIGLVAFAFIFYGAPGAIKAQLIELFSFVFSARILNPIQWVWVILFRLANPWRWRDLIFGYGGPVILNGSDQSWAHVKKPLLSVASGNVLEVGAGSGASIKYYDGKKIKHLWLLEPFEGLHKELEQSLKQASQPGKPGEGLEHRASIVPFGVQDYEHLPSEGITEESMDTVVLVQVLCSIEQPKSHIGALIRYLKPGGKLIMFEHVRSKHPVTSMIQELYTTVFWRFLANGCELTRASGEWVSSMGEWESKEILRPTVEHDGELFPHSVAIFTKKSV